MIHDPRRQVIRPIKFSHLKQLQQPVALRFINLSRNTQKIVGILPYSPLHLIAEDEPSIERRYTLVILPPRTRRRKISNSTDALSPSQAPIFFSSRASSDRRHHRRRFPIQFGGLLLLTVSVHQSEEESLLHRYMMLTPRKAPVVILIFNEIYSFSP